MTTRLVSFLSPFRVMKETILTMVYIPIIMPIVLIVGVMIFLLSLDLKKSGGDQPFCWWASVLASSKILSRCPSLLKIITNEN